MTKPEPFPRVGAARATLHADIQTEKISTMQDSYVREIPVQTLHRFQVHDLEIAIPADAPKHLSHREYQEHVAESMAVAAREAVMEIFTPPEPDQDEMNPFRVVRPFYQRPVTERIPMPNESEIARLAAEVEEYIR